MPGWIWIVDIVSSIPTSLPAHGWRGSPEPFARPLALVRLLCRAANRRSEIDSQAATTISTAVAADDSSSGGVTGTAGISSASSPSPTRCDSGMLRRRQPLEQHIAEQIERRPAEQHRGGRDSVWPPG